MAEQQPRELKKHNVSTATVFFMIFCMVCAGAYGIEDMIPASGPGLTLILLMVLPFFWSIPQGLIAAELGSAIPEEGGYYKWIQRALGEFWGFQAGWWRTLSIYIDSTLYIVLMTSYLESMIELTAWQSFAFKALFIVIFTYINIRGLSDVGRIASYFSIFVIVLFVIMIGVGFAEWQYNPFTPFTPPGQGVMSSIGLGVAICMWMYAGYESMSTMAGEVSNPQVIPKATILSVPAIMLLYILATMSGLAAVGNWQQWSTEGGITFGTVAVNLGIPIFGIVFGIAAVVSNASMYNTYLASGSRGFYAMAEDKLMPRFFSDIHPKYGTPYKAIISMSVVNLILCQYGFDVLVVLDVFLLMFAYILIYIAAIVLRIKEPDLERPFKVPLGTRGIIIMCIPPILLAVIALFTNGLIYFIGGCIGVVSGPIAYYFLRRKYGGIMESPHIFRRSKLAACLLCGLMVIFIAVAGVMVVGDRKDAHQAFATYATDNGLELNDVSFDWSEELYMAQVSGTDEYEYILYYDGTNDVGEAQFFSELEFDHVFADETEFADMTLSVLNTEGYLGEYVDVSSKNYVCYGLEPGQYANAGDLAAEVNKAY